MSIGKILLPYSITGYDNILIQLFIPIEFPDFGRANNHLLLICLIFILFVDKITKGSGYIDAAIDTAMIDVAPCFYYSILLMSIMWFVILRQFDSFAISA